jgi:hypothetical protein
MVASFTNSNAMGMSTGNNVWYTGDFNTADEVVGCAIQNLHIDTRHIFTAGGSAGALQAPWLSYARSGYIAAAGAISAGLDGFGPTFLTQTSTPQDPTNIASAFASHGAPRADVVIIDFAVASAGWEADVHKKGGFSVDCNNGGGHVGTLGLVGPAMWEFFKDHPFKTKVDPYKERPSRGLSEVLPPRSAALRRWSSVEGPRFRSDAPRLRRYTRRGLAEARWKAGADASGHRDPRWIERWQAD